MGELVIIPVRVPAIIAEMLLLELLSLDYFSFFSPCLENYCRKCVPTITSYCWKVVGR